MNASYNNIVTTNGGTMNIKIDLSTITTSRARRELAQKVKSSQILKELSKDEVWSVRRAVVANPNTDQEILRKLSGDDDVDIRCAVIIKQCQQ